MSVDIEKLIRDDLENRVNKDSREKFLREYYNNPNRCQYCNGIIFINKKDKPSAVRRKKFCSDECFNLSRKTRNDACLNCGNELNPTSKKYCSVNCQSEYEQKIWEEKWLNGEVSGNKNSIWTQVSDRVRTYLFRKYDNKCSRCGWGEMNPYTGKIPLEVEHIDGNANNTIPENVTLLCPNCHSLTSTYRGANRGNGRPKTWIPKSIEVDI